METSYKSNETKCRNCHERIILSVGEMNKTYYTCPNCFYLNHIPLTDNSIINHSLITHDDKETIENFDYDNPYNKFRHKHIPERPFLAKHTGIVVIIQTVLTAIAFYHGYETGNWMWGPLAGGFSLILYKKYIKPYDK